MEHLYVKAVIVIFLGEGGSRRRINLDFYVIAITIPVWKYGVSNWAREDCSHMSANLASESEKNNRTA